MAHPELIAHETQTRKDIVTLADGIWSFVGFAASNVHVIEGRNSLTVIDTTESTRAAKNILAELRKLSDKPIGRIILTHSHRDHISGISVFQDQDQPIYASALFRSDLIDVDPNKIAPNQALGRRTQAQFGIGLTDQERISLGCGPGNRPMEGLGAGFRPPTELISKTQEIDLDGHRATFHLIPGETEDHMALWLEDQKVLFSGDNWYHAFPNLYAIRGTAYRDFAVWADGLDRLMVFNAEALAPGHTRPVQGRENVQDVLGSTRDAIRFVMQYTADAMDQGQSLDDIASSIKLPQELAQKPWLKEFYGKVAWSARAFATGTLGWYDGNPTNLGTLSSQTRAEHIARLAGGTEALRQEAENTQDPQWCLELCDHLDALGQNCQSLKAATMRKLAEAEINATARNTYLWEAKRLEEET